MDANLQRDCARYIYVVPDGLHELMTDISREVLRDQPDDIYTYIADYLDALLITRENARIAAQFVQNLTEVAETIVELLQQAGMSRDEANKSAEIIQDAFRAWRSRTGTIKEDEETLTARIIEDAGIPESQVNIAAQVIQNAFRTFKLRQQREKELLGGITDWRVAARSAIRLYRKTGVSPEEAKRAATLIKAAYKGYYTRRALRQLNEQGASLPEGAEEEEDEEVDEEEEEEGDEATEGSVSLASYLEGGERKSKGVRIDFTSVEPRVDFGSEERISRDIESIIEETEPPPNPDVMIRIFGDIAEPEKTDEDLVRELLHELVDRVIHGLGSINLPVIEDKDSDLDLFVTPSGEGHAAPLVNRSVALPMVSQHELEDELTEAKQEAVKLKQTVEETHVVEDVRSSTFGVGRDAASRVQLNKQAGAEKSAEYIPTEGPKAPSEEGKPEKAEAEPPSEEGKPEATSEEGKLKSPSEEAKSEASGKEAKPEAPSEAAKSEERSEEAELEGQTESSTQTDPLVLRKITPESDEPAQDLPVEAAQDLPVEAARDLPVEVAQDLPGEATQDLSVEAAPETETQPEETEVVVSAPETVTEETVPAEVHEVSEENPE